MVGGVATCGRAGGGGAGGDGRGAEKDEGAGVELSVAGAEPASSALAVVGGDPGEGKAGGSGGVEGVIWVLAKITSGSRSKTKITALGWVG